MIKLGIVQKKVDVTCVIPLYAIAVVVIVMLLELQTKITRQRVSTDSIITHGAVH